MVLLYKYMNIFITMFGESRVNECVSSNPIHSSPNVWAKMKQVLEAVMALYAIALYLLSFAGS